jgi:hypothetical protein
MLQSLGFELPRELNASAEFTLGKRFTEEIRIQHQSHDPASYQKAIEISQEVARHGFHIDSAEAGRIFEGMIASVVDEVVLEGDESLAETARTLVELMRRMAIRPSLDRAQEILYTALPRMAPKISEPLRRLALSIGFAPEAVDLLLVKTPPKAEAAPPAAGAKP